MMAEPCRMKMNNMDEFIKTHLDGNVMTTTAVPGSMMEVLDMEIVDGQLVATLAVEGSSSVPGRVHEESRKKRKEMRRKERKEMGRKESLEGMGCVDGWCSQTTMVANELDAEWKVFERKETEGKEAERKEKERKEIERRATERKEIEKKEFDKMEMEKKEIERKEMERKEMERKETERKGTLEGRRNLSTDELGTIILEWASWVDLIRGNLGNSFRYNKELNWCALEIREITTELLSRFCESERENDCLKRREIEMKEIERKELERKEAEKKENERKETERKESERKEMERKEMERKEMERKEIERKKMERKELERKESERMMMERKERERKENDRKEEVKDEKMCDGPGDRGAPNIKMDWANMMYRKRKAMEKVMERKETERKEAERKEFERKETERKKMERKELERKETERKESKRKETVRKEMERKENERKKMERRKMERKETERKETGRKEMGRKETERKEIEGKELERRKACLVMAEGSNITSISPFLIGEDFPLPPLLQRVTCNFIARSGGDYMPPVVQSPHPMVNRGSEGAKTDGGACEDVILEDGSMSGLETEWRLVGGGRRGRDPLPPPSLPDSGMELSGPSDCIERRSLFGQHLKSRPRPPTSTAVLISGRTEGFSSVDALRNARKSIDLDSLGIRTTYIRKTVNGGLLIEVPGKDSRMKAEKLVTRLRDVLKDTAAVFCPSRKSDIRVFGFDESVLSDEIAKMVSCFGSCPIADVKVGPIRTNNGLGTVMVQLPVEAASKLAGIGCIRLGWTMAKVELLRTRPLQCYRCWKYGHVQNTCNSVVDRRDACFKCGQLGHMVRNCQNMAHCMVCFNMGLEASHRLGGPHCVALVKQTTSLKS